jgi:hypothetical protein
MPLFLGSETEGFLENGIYAVIQTDDNFVKCLCGNNVDSSTVSLLDLSYIIPFAKFMVLHFDPNYEIKQCILENFIFVTGDYPLWLIKICEEDDNLSELYGGAASTLLNRLMFIISIPCYIPENDTSSSTYSLRNTNQFDILREKFEQMRQQNLDNPTE